MRHGGEKGGSQLVRCRDGTGFLGARLELPEVHRRSELLRERVEDTAILGANRRARDRQYVRGVELDRGRARLGALRNTVAARGLDPPTALESMEDCGPLELQYAPEPVEDRRDGRRARETRKRLRLGARPGALGSPAGGERHEARDDRSDGEEHEEREDVFRLGDRERVERRDEEPVDEQERTDRRCEPGCEPAAAATATTSSRKRSITLGSSSSPRSGTRRVVSSGSPATARSAPSTPASAGKGGGATRARDDECLLRPSLGVADDVNVDRDAGLADDLADDRAPREALPARAACRTHDELRDVQRARCVEQRHSHVGADDLVIRAAELRHEHTLLTEQLGRGSGEAVLRNHMDGDEIALRTLCDPRGPADEPLTVRGAREGDHDPLARFPRLRDAVLAPVLLEPFVDPIREPGKSELAERGEVAGSKVVGERRVDPLGWIHVAAGEAVAERYRGEVDQLQLVGAANDLVGDRLPLPDAGDLLDDVVERREVLDVQRRDDVDARLQKLVHVLPALFVPGPGDVRVRKLVHQRDLGSPREGGIHVHLLERGLAMPEPLARNDLEVADLLGGLSPPVRLDEPDHHVLAVLAAPTAFVQHREGLTDARGGTEIDTELSSRHRYSVPPSPSRRRARG